MEEYQKQPPDDFVPTKEEEALIDCYGLSLNQLFWRRLKIIEFNAAEGVDSGIIAFKQEYPMNAEEAFQFSGGDTLIKSEHCMFARNRNVEGWGPLYVGIDPSYGGDRFAIVWRHGPKICNYAVYTGSQVATFQQRFEICYNVLTIADPVSGRLPDMVSIDYAVGKDIVDELNRAGFAKKVRAVHFGEVPKLLKNKEKYGNRRNEIYGLLYEWLVDEAVPCQIPDDDEFQADLCATPYRYDHYERKILKDKAAIKKEYGFSPDLADAAALTFANLLVEQEPTRLPTAIPILGGEGYRKAQRKYSARTADKNIARMSDPATKKMRELKKKIAHKEQQLKEMKQNSRLDAHNRDKYLPKAERNKHDRGK